MARRGKTQGDIAELLNITRQGVSQRLLGRVDFRVGELQRIADYLAVPVADLISEAVA
jgi:transcriptional regulator with XRE-family HTH domain